jgi:hypothetical protein
MKKWLDKYEAPKAQNGIEGTMGGLTDKGFNYNGAWGGTMQEGGSLPGSVGFTYARTGDIPSNGPYAKKTKASAQKGASVSDNTRLKPIVTEKPMNRETVRSTKPFEAKDNRSIFNDSRAKDRMNNEYSQYVQNIYKDTFIDQIPYAAPVLAAKAFNEGLPFTALSELIKQPLGVVGDAAINAIQENPESIDVKTLEEKTIPYTRLAANATFGNPVITQIGKQRVESGKKKGSKWYDFTAYELPALMDAANSYGVDDNTFTQFIEDNWKSSGGSYKKILELADKKFSKKQNGGEMKYYQEGLDFKPKTISEDGSIITPYGQWEYPGEITTIPSNEITMEGVPYPVLGISDTGDTQMMYPEEEYEFDGESVTEYPIAQNGKKVKVSMSDFKKIGNSYKDSVNTYDYNQALWDAVRSQKSSEVDEAISQNKNLIRNTSNIKPTSYDNVTVGGKNYRIPNYQYPQMDPWETYEPVEGWWERAQSSLNSVNNAINKTSIGKQLMKVNDKIDETLTDIWHKFTSDDKTNNVINKGAEVFTNKQPVSKPTPKPVAKKETPDRFGLTKEDYIQAHKSKPVLTPGNKKGDAYYELKKNGKTYKVYTKSGGNNWVDLPEREFNKLYPITNKTPVKPKSKKEEPAKPQPKPQETKKPEPRPQNVYEGSPVYSPGTGSGLPSALIGFANQQGDTTYIKPEDYERFAVPKYGKEFIESKKKQRNGGVNSADAQPIKKLDQLLNFTNYNKPSKGGWLSKYED